MKDKILQALTDKVNEIIIEIQDENEITDGCEPFDTILDELIEDLTDEMIRTIEFQLFMKSMNEEGEA